MHADGNLHESLQEVTRILRAEGHAGSVKPWMAAACLAPYLYSTQVEPLYERSCYTKPTTAFHAQKKGVSKEDLERFHAYSKLCPKLSKIYFPKKTADIFARSWGQVPFETHIRAHGLMCEKLGVTLACARYMIETWWTQYRRTEGGKSKRKF